MQTPHEAVPPSPPARESRAGVRLALRAAAVAAGLLVVAAAAWGGYVARGVVDSRSTSAVPPRLNVHSWIDQVRRDPQDPAAHLGLGYAYQNANRFDLALREYRTVLERNPADTAALYNTATVYLRLGIEDRAEETLRKVLAIDATHALAAQTLGDIYAKDRRWEALAQVVEPAMGAHPDVAHLHYLDGLALEYLGRPDEAAAQYGLALEYAPDDQEARAGLERLRATP